MSAKRLATTALDWGVVAAKIPAENRAAFGALKVKRTKVCVCVCGGGLYVYLKHHSPMLKISPFRY